MVDDTKRLDGNGLARVWTATQKLVADNINDGVPVNGVVEFDGLEADIPDGYTKIGTRDSRLLIKKGEKTIPVRSTVVNEETASDTDVYSCEYINDKLEDVEDAFSGIIPQGNIVVNSIRSKNMFDKRTIVSGDICNYTPTIRLSSRQNIYLNAGTYTFSTNLPSTYNYGIQVQTVGYPPLTTYPTYIYDSGWITDNIVTFTINTNAYFSIAIRKSDNSTLTPNNIMSYNFQLEIGSIATNYMPYQNLDGKEVYSTGEAVIGTWINGKPLYRKVFTYNINTANVQNTITHNISNLGWVSRCDVAMYNEYDFYITGSSLTGSFETSLDGTSIYLKSLIYTGDCTIIIEYTKTTD